MGQVNCVEEVDDHTVRIIYEKEVEDADGRDNDMVMEDRGTVKENWWLNTQMMYCMCNASEINICECRMSINGL